jgi:hypothetical protein
LKKRNEKFYKWFGKLRRMLRVTLFRRIGIMELNTSIR